jgi:IPT/TIG domain/Right handed beta helix region/NHL repeat
LERQFTATLSPIAGSQWADAIYVGSDAGMRSLAWRGMAGLMKLSVRVAALLFAWVAAVSPAAAQTVVTLYSQYNAPQFVAVDANRTVFVTDTTYSLSALGLANGTYAATPTAYDTNFATLYVSPNGVAVGPDGHIFSVSMSSSVPGFFFLWEFGPPDYHEIVDGSLPSSGGAVNGVAIDSQGNFFVADTNGTAIKIFAPDYQAATSFSTGQSGVDHPFGIAFDSHDNLFVTDRLSGSGQILEYATAGGIALTNTITIGNLQQPAGVAVDTHGNLYVADSAANTLTEFAAPDYTNAQVIVSTGLSGPTGVAVDAGDNIFVVDTGHNALKEILALPAVTALAPSAGPLAGGNTVTITGAHLTGATAVSFGSNAASNVTVVSDTQVTATVPAGSSGTVDVRVTTPNGTSIAAPADKYTYTSGATVGALNPRSGPTAGGNIVTIAGTNLSSASAVSFGAMPATSFSVLGQTLISAVAPPGAAGTVDVTVTTPGGTSPTGSSDQYTYVAAPTVSAVSPNAGPTVGGTGVTISGTGFTGATAVSFGATSATSFSVTSNTSIAATSPAGSGTVDVTVTTSGGTSAIGAADGFTYIPMPTVTGLAPATGPAAGGTIVTITGTNFSGATAVKFGGSAATWFNVMSATSITAKAPAGSGTVDVRVTTTFGTSTTSASDQFIYAAATSRTFVSASTGSDSNTCTRAAPCLTFAAALKNTSAGGEIDVLDPGDFGPVTLTESITIDGGNGPVAGTGVVPGSSGITVNAAATDVITLRGLAFNGYGETGASGVVFNSGSRLVIEQCAFQGFDTAGIAFTPGTGSAATAQMFVDNSTIVGNAGGVLVKPTAGIATAVTLAQVHIDQNTGGGLIADGTSGSGPIQVAIDDSSASFNASNGIAVTSAQAGVKVDATRDTIAANGLAGIQSEGGSATVTVGSSQIRGNGIGLQSIGGGVLFSYANNQVTGNGSDGSFTTTGLQ